MVVGVCGSLTQTLITNNRINTHVVQQGVWGSAMICPSRHGTPLLDDVLSVYSLGKPPPDTQSDLLLTEFSKDSYKHG